MIVIVFNAFFTKALDRMLKVNVYFNEVKQDCSSQTLDAIG